MIGIVARAFTLAARAFGRGHVYRTAGSMSENPIPEADEMSRMDDREQQRAPVLMTPSYHKLVDVVLFLLTLARDRSETLTTYEIVKAVFLADRTHLNVYGRPVTFDLYRAMRHGPVPSAIYDLLLADPAVLERTGPVRWKRKPRPDLSSRAYEYYAPERPPNLASVLSRSDAEALTDGYDKVKRLGFTELRRLTHKDLAYRAAWGKRKGNEAATMDYALLLDDPDPDIIADLQALSANLHVRA